MCVPVCVVGVLCVPARVLYEYARWSMHVARTHTHNASTHTHCSGSVGQAAPKRTQAAGAFAKRKSSAGNTQSCLFHIPAAHIASSSGSYKTLSSLHMWV